MQNSRTLPISPRPPTVTTLARRPPALPSTHYHLVGLYGRQLESREPHTSGGGLWSTGHPSWRWRPFPVHRHPGLVFEYSCESVRYFTNPPSPRGHGADRGAPRYSRRPPPAAHLSSPWHITPHGAWQWVGTTSSPPLGNIRLTLSHHRALAYRATGTRSVEFGGLLLSGKLLNCRRGYCRDAHVVNLFAAVYTNSARYVFFCCKIEFKSYGKTKPCKTLQIRQRTTQNESEIQAVHLRGTPLAVR